MNHNDISSKLKAITDNFELENYDVVIQQALVLIEKKLRELIKRDLIQLNSPVQITVMKHLANRNKTIDDLTMGEIVGLLRETKFFDAWKQKFHRDLCVFETIDLNKLVIFRNDVAHGKPTMHTKEEAELVMYYRQIVFQVFDELENSVDRGKIRQVSFIKALKKPIVTFSVIAVLFLWVAFGFRDRLLIDITPKEVAQLPEQVPRDVNVPTCEGAEYDRAGVLSSKVGEILVDKFGGGRNIRVQMTSCEFDSYTKIFKTKIEIHWNGVIFGNHYYRIDGEVRMKTDGSDVEFLQIYANDSVKKLNFWQKGIIAGQLVMGDIATDVKLKK